MKGTKYYVFDLASGMTLAGPYDDRLVAMRQADLLEQSMGGQR